MAKDKVCRILCCNGKTGSGTALYMNAQARSWDFDGNLDDMCLDDSPVGIRVAEGSWVVTGDLPRDYDIAWQGIFREPTSREWAAIQRGRSPWR